MHQDMPSDEGLFTLECASVIHQLKPELDVEPIGPLSLSIGGKKLDLHNLYKIALSSSNRQEVIRIYLEQILEADDIFANDIKTDFLSVRSQLYPRIQHKSIFNEIDSNSIAYTDWVNDCVICYVMDYPQMTVSVSTEQLVYWDLDIDDIHKVALHNLSKTMNNIEVQYVTMKDQDEAIVISTEDGYDASRILTTELYEAIASQFHGDFYVGLPSRDILFAVPVKGTSSSFLKKVKMNMVKDYRSLPYPITPSLFYVTMDGVAKAFTDPILPSVSEEE